jgi:hypothetical protein
MVVTVAGGVMQVPGNSRVFAAEMSGGTHAAVSVIVFAASIMRRRIGLT